MERGFEDNYVNPLTPLERGLEDNYVNPLYLSGAGDGIRTRDFHLGKVAFYH